MNNLNKTYGYTVKAQCEDPLSALRVQTAWYNEAGKLQDRSIVVRSCGLANIATVQGEVLVSPESVKGSILVKAEGKGPIRLLSVSLRH